ncbi:hypothetical protein POM88_041005 [Heracleum sosnowskyi]|uniref:Uncharacterized protein n=1 Tax=Heracleum sosnowskyi TaxID=360622 RepID=A0AAD8HFM6_9APIA|nr:hypothetical protein POM88_041005 [Heracleum sosnowskyi]
MAQGESSNQKLRLIRSSQVTWAGPSKKKVRVNKGKARRNSRTSEEDRMEGAGEGRSDSDEESYVDGSNEMQVCNMIITYERKSRSSCEGDYPTKPPTDAKPTIDLLNNGKGLMVPKPKHTLTHIVRLRWDENTLNTKGVKREAFYNDYIKEFKEIDAEREAKGEMPIMDDEFMTFVYDPCDPAVKELQKEIQLKKDLQVTLQAIPPKGGRVFLRPNETLGKIVGAQEAAKWAKQTVQPAPVDIPDDIFTMMSKILDAVQQMVRSLPTHEVKQFVLDEQVRNLATATFPDPSQQSKKILYVRTTSSLLPQVLKDSDRIIVEMSIRT